MKAAMASCVANFAVRLGHARARSFLIAGGMILGLTFAIAIAVIIYVQIQPVIDDAVREMRNDALLLAEEEDRLLQSIDGVQLSLIQAMREAGIDTPEEFRRRMGTESEYRNLRSRIQALPAAVSLSLCDDQTVLLNVSSAWPTPPVDDVDHAFLQTLTAGNDAGPIISTPWRSKVTGEWMMFVGRRFEATGGRLI